MFYFLTIVSNGTRSATEVFCCSTACIYIYIQILHRGKVKYCPNINILATERSKCAVVCDIRISERIYVFIIIHVRNCNVYFAYIRTRETLDSYSLKYHRTYIHS